MKKLSAIILMSGFTLSLFAVDPIKDQNNSFRSSGDGAKSFDESSHVLNFGVGFGGRSYQSVNKGTKYSHGRTPVFSFSYEQPWPKRLGPGYLGVGAIFAFQHEYYKYDYNYSTGSGFTNATYYYHHKWSYYMLAGRAAYHWDVLNSEKAEVYAGMIAGVRLQTHNYETNDPGKNDPYNYSEGAVFPTFNVFAGARWYFAKNVGVYAEAGYGISFVTVGLSIKF